MMAVPIVLWMLFLSPRAPVERLMTQAEAIAAASSGPHWWSWRSMKQRSVATGASRLGGSAAFDGG
jgi:hypothetical protein